LAVVAVAAAAGLVLGACGGTLYDPGRLPAKDAGAGLTCTEPGTHACGDACVSQDAGHCGTCDPCPAPPANASPVATCTPGAGGDYACGFTCNPGFFTCGAACCAATAVAAGGNHSCAVLDDGSLTCWGANDAGQLDPTLAATSSQRPVRVLASGVTHVALGAHHTCAIQAGAVRCWGANDAGQLGSGAVGGGPGPFTVPVVGATLIAAGTHHTCAIVAGGAVRCWGTNLAGQLGTGGVSSASGSPTSSLVTASATAVATLADTTCALVGAQVRCWGANGTGQIGNLTAPNPQPTPDPAAIPTTGGTLPGFIAVGGGHACAGMSPGGLTCWGDDSKTQLGSTSSVTQSSTPLQANKIDNNQLSIRAIAGAAFTCSGKDALELKCAGANDQGQTGSPPSPTAEGTVTFGGNILAASAGLEHACALVDLTPTATPTLVVQCWGRNAEGQLGRKTTPAGSPSASPVLVGP
jgi:alpha-tubulin suppressor-like RCC1 family protein